jgi:histidinol-phosphate aminotransferase
MLPITGLACATASMKVANLVPERRAINKRIRSNTFEFLEKKQIAYIPSETNFFMMDVKGSGAEFAKKMAEQKVFIGRMWPVWPTKVRVSVGTQAEMDRFTAAVTKIVG